MFKKLKEFFIVKVLHKTTITNTKNKVVNITPKCKHEFGKYKFVKGGGRTATCKKCGTQILIKFDKVNNCKITYYTYPKHE